MRRTLSPLVTTLTVLAALLLSWLSNAAIATEFRVDTQYAVQQHRARVALASDGRFWIAWTAWLDLDMSDDQAVSLATYARAFGPAGTSPGPQIALDASNSASNGFADVAVLPGGDALVVWSAYRTRPGFPAPFDKGYDLLAQVIAPTGVPVDQPTRIDLGIPWVGEARVVADPSGKSYLSWSRASSDLLLCAYDPSSHQVGDPSWLITGFDDYSHTVADIAFSPVGRGIVLWHSKDANARDRSLSGRMFDATGALTTGNILQNRIPGIEPFHARAAMDAQGGFVVVWESRGGIPDGVYARRFPLGETPPSEAIRVDEGIRIWGIPDVAMTSDGRFVAVWTQQDDAWTRTDILGRVYHANGSPAGPRFRVNTQIGGFNGRPAVAMNDAGDIVVAWDRDGIFARAIAASEVALPAQSVGALKARFRRAN
jgi:hypothetical protein